MRRFLLRTSSALALAAAAVLCPGAARADLVINYTAVWSGTPFSDDASATGQVKIDITTTTILDAAITVSGAVNSQGDGTFSANGFDGTGAFSSFLLDFNGGLTSGNYNTELVGQPTVGGGTWATSESGDFNFFSNFSNYPFAPQGVAPFTLGTDGGEGNFLALVSLAPITVPEPASAVVLAVGLAGMVRLRKWGRAKAKG